MGNVTLPFLIPMKCVIRSSQLRFECWKRAGSSVNDRNGQKHVERLCWKAVSM